MQCLRIPSVDPSEGQIYPLNTHSVLTLGSLSLHRRRKTVLFLVGCNGHLALISAGLSRKVSLIGSLLAMLSLSMTCRSVLVVACCERWEGSCLFLLSGQHCPSWVRKGEEDSLSEMSSKPASSTAQVPSALSPMTSWHESWLTAQQILGQDPGLEVTHAKDSSVSSVTGHCPTFMSWRAPAGRILQQGRKGDA